MDEKACQQVAAYGHATWQRVGVHACVYAGVCVHRCACVRGER